MTNRSQGTRSLNGEIRALEGQAAGDQRKFRLSFSSEEPYERYFGPEILSHREGAVDMTRLNELGVVLFNHNRERVIGKINRAWTEEGRGMADIEFDDDEFSETIRKKVENKTLRGVSVGYTVKTWEDVAENHKSADGFTGPCCIARAWTPYEISIVSVPADPTVGVGRAEEDGHGSEGNPPPGLPKEKDQTPETAGMTIEAAERRIRQNETIFNGR